MRPGKNVIGVEVLFYGHGDGTWPAGKPGMIFNLVIQHRDGHCERIVSDPSWQAMIDRAHRPGHFKRWYLRSLQEEFDARLHPLGWDMAGFAADARWTPAMPLDCPADKPAACSGYSGNDLIERADPNRSSLRLRQIPLLRDRKVPAMRLAESAVFNGFGIRPTGLSSACRTHFTSSSNPWPKNATDRHGNYRRPPIRGRGFL